MNITPTMIKDYIFCPALVWYKQNYETTKPITPSMQAGKQADLKKQAEKLGLPKPVILEKCLKDQKTGLIGCPDIIAGKRHRIVIEVKKFPRKKAHSQYFIIQAKAYAFLVEKTLGKVRKYGLILGEKLYLYDYHQKDQEDIEKIIANIQNTIKKPNPPFTPQDKRKCNTCDYRKECIIKQSSRIPIL